MAHKWLKWLMETRQTRHRNGHDEDIMVTIGTWIIPGSTGKRAMNSRLFEMRHLWDIWVIKEAKGATQPAHRRLMKTRHKPAKPVTAYPHHPFAISAFHAVKIF